MPRRLAAIMFTDIADYTALSQADEKGALRLLREQEGLVWPILELHRGRKVKSMGDGLLIEFPDALDAVECAVDLQHHVQERNVREETTPLRLRIGIHLGDVEGAGTDILGDAVNIAQRIESVAEPGGVSLSEPVYVQVRNKVSYRLEELGPKTLKGVQEPITVYRVAFAGVAGPSPSRASSPPRIAVLPLKNISPDPKDEYFADGLTEELITVLSQIKGLRVISRTSVNQYKGTTKPVAQIGSELGTDSVLEGSVRKAGDQLRIAVQLIDTRTDEHRWAQTYDRMLENVFEIQAEVAEQTARALKVELLRGERESLQERPTSNPQAYEAYLRALQATRLFAESRSILNVPEGGRCYELDREAVHHFEEAIRSDPRFSAAYALLANHLIFVMGETRPAAEVIPRARELVERALELNPNSSDAHLARGNLAMQGDLDWVRAEAEFQQAIALNPSSSIARLWYGMLLFHLQRHDESRKQFLAALDMDPLRIGLKFMLVGIAAARGDFEQALALGRDLLRQSESTSVTRRELSMWLLNAGDWEEVDAMLAGLAKSSDPADSFTHALLLARMGEPGELRATVSRWEDGRMQGYRSKCEVATWYALVGDKERALALLEEDTRIGERSLWNFYQSILFDSIRDDPRFEAMLRGMNLPTTLSRPHWSGRGPLSTGTARSRSCPPSH